MIKNGMRPVHPGEVLHEDYLVPLGISANEGRRVILEPVDVWPKSFVRSLGSWHEEIERPNQGAPESWL